MAPVWVLGAKGFIGQYLSRYLAGKGHRVLGLGHGLWPVELAAETGVSYWINGEIDSANLSQLLKVGGAPATIYHLAGGSSVGLSMQSPLEDFQRTVSTTAALLEWVRAFQPDSKIVSVSSAAVYGDCPKPVLAEDGQYTPYSPYGFHKRLLELLCESYVRNFGLKVAIVRLFSIYGAGLQKQLLWDFGGRLMERPQQMTMHGTGAELRDWLHVSDAVRLLDAAASCAGDDFTILNGGTGVGTSVATVLNMMCAAWGCSPELVFSGDRRTGDPINLVADVSRVKKLLNVQPQMQLADGIADYVRWLKEVRA